MGLQAVALGAEREHRARRNALQTVGVPLRVDRDQRPVVRDSRRHAEHRQGEVQPGRAADGARIPRVVVAGGQDGRAVGGRGDADDRSHVPEIARVLQQDDRPVRRGGPDALRRVPGTAGEADDSGVGRPRRRERQQLRVGGAQEAAERRTHVRRQLGGEGVGRV